MRALFSHEITHWERDVPQAYLFWWKVKYALGGHGISLKLNVFSGMS